MNTEASKESLPITWKVKQGDKFLVEIEITKDTDLVNETNEILSSVYAGKDLGGFKINIVHFCKSKDDLVSKILEKIREAAISV